jgi:PhnB protein
LLNIQLIKSPEGAEMSTTPPPIPNGTQTVVPSLIVDGAAEAIEFYQKAFAAEVIERHDMPGGDKVMHAQIRIGDSMLYVSDEYPEWDCNGPKTIGATPVSLTIWSKDIDAAFARAVEAGCEVTMPLNLQFWGDKMGKLKDPYGHQWSMMMQVETVSDEEVQKRADEMFSQS